MKTITAGGRYRVYLSEDSGREWFVSARTPEEAAMNAYAATGGTSKIIDHAVWDVHSIVSGRCREAGVVDNGAFAPDPDWLASELRPKSGLVGRPKTAPGEETAVVALAELIDESKKIHGKTLPVIGKSRIVNRMITSYPFLSTKTLQRVVDRAIAMGMIARSPSGFLSLP